MSVKKALGFRRKFIPGHTRRLNPNAYLRGSGCGFSPRCRSGINFSGSGYRAGSFKIALHRVFSACCVWSKRVRIPDIREDHSTFRNEITLVDIVLREAVRQA